MTREPELKRSIGDGIAFTVVFFAIVFTIAGVVISSVPTAVVSFFVALLGIAYFILTGWL